MKTSTRVIHAIVKGIGAEEIFVRFARINPLFRKFVPVPSDYGRNDIRVVIRDHTRFKLNLSDYMQWHLFADVPDQVSVLATSYITPGSVVLDIGANCGHFSLKLAVYCREQNLSNVQIHAFEPNPKVYKSLEENAALNNLNSNQLILRPIGLGRENEKRFFNYSEENMGAGRIVRGQRGQLEVIVRKLDDLVTEINPRTIAFVKLDVEGFEPEVFEGSWNTLAKFKPPIFFEVTPRWYVENGYLVSDVLKRLSLLGYKFMLESENGLIPYNEGECANLIQYNLLAIHGSK